MDKTYFSVIVPSYNNATFLDIAIQSVVNQTYPYWELILVDDGSKDESLALCHKWSLQDPRIKLFCHAGNKNKGVSASRNLGIDHANYPFIALLDSDDVWLSHKLQEQSDVIKKYPEVDFIYSKAEVIDENNKSVIDQPDKVALLKRPPIFGGGPSDLTNNFKYFIQAPPRIPASSVVFRKKNWRFDESLTNQVEDSLLFLRILENGNVYFIPEVLIYYRVHGKQWNNKLNDIRRLNSRFELYFSLLRHVDRQHRKLVCHRLFREAISKYPFNTKSADSEIQTAKRNIRAFFRSGKVDVSMKARYLLHVLRLVSKTPLG